jgi:GT2 family glycosyltransferase/glycosyltransferase involved in cell wall biosynthesis
VTGVSIVIPVFNALEELRRCIASLYSTPQRVAFEVLVVNNGSCGEVGDWLETQQRERTDFRILSFPGPLGFARAVNAGAAVARFDFLALLNSDTIAGEGWLDRLAEALLNDPGLGIVSPITNRCGTPLQCDPSAQSLRPEETASFAESVSGRAGVRNEPQRLVFFCVLLRRELWLKLGGLDEAYRTGNYEDDDFCLRTRMAGYRMAVIPSAFVYHHERRTFESNRLNHGEWLARNQSLFLEKASRWSRELRSPIPGCAQAGFLTVVVPVTPGRAPGLNDTLASLANQTVQEFETLIVKPRRVDLSHTVQAFDGRLRIQTLSIDSEDEFPGALLNAGLAAAGGTEIAYLPAGDIFYPFHLEALLDGLSGTDADAVYTAWQVAIESPGGTRRGSVIFPRAEPDIELGDWAPLLCWMHRKASAAGLCFETFAGNFSPWLFLIRLSGRAAATYLCRATCERRPDPPAQRDATDIESILQRFPTGDKWKQSQRYMFLEAVRLGNWENRLVVSHNDRARRVRSLLESQALGVLKSRFQSLASQIQPAWRDSEKPDIFVFTTVEWTSLTQRQHHFASGLAARGHRVFWIGVRLRPPEQMNTANFISEGGTGLYEVHLPAFGSDIYRMEWRPDVLDAWSAAFEYLRAVHGVATAVQLVNYPRWQPVCHALAERWQWPVVYDCLDDQAALGELFGHDMEAFESRLIQDSAAVVVSGPVLHEVVRPVRPDAILIPNGADFKLFHNARSSGLLADLPRPVAGFFGAFAEWLDYDWIDAAAQRFPNWSFVYIGRENFARTSTAARWRTLAGRSNLHVFPQASQSKLAEYLADFDVCTMPFRDLRVTRSMNAVKLFEYLAAGKPVVAADLPETRRFRDAGLIATYTSLENSFRLLEEAVREGMQPDKVAARVAFARRNTWTQRLEGLSQVIARAAQTGSTSWIHPTRV